LSGWQEIVFYDDIYSPNSRTGIWPLKGGTSHLIESLGRVDGVVVGIGDSHTRLKKYTDLSVAGAVVVTIFHPTSTISSFAKIGLGSVVFAGAVINVGAKLGHAVIINTGATVDHDCVLGDGVHIAPGAHLSGDVHVGACSWVGVGASVKQGIRIGSDVMIGAGAVVISDIPDGQTVVGNPAQVIPSR